jgi:hypothetical protein
MSHLQRPSTIPAMSTLPYLIEGGGNTVRPSSSVTPVKENNTKNSTKDKIASCNRYAPIADLSEQEEKDHLDTSLQTPVLAPIPDHQQQLPCPQHVTPPQDTERLGTGDHLHLSCLTTILTLTWKRSLSKWESTGINLLKQQMALPTLTALKILLP